jgi:peptide-methionine (S)-S-oxide reductase
MKFATALLLSAGLLGSAEVPPPAADVAATPGEHRAIAVVAGGCFWGVDAVFKHVKGVVQVVSGYAGGEKSTARYEVVETGKTGHAESVQIAYDPAQVSYGKLLQVFFSVAHDPTQLNRQGPDWGTQYRSAIFYSSSDQKRVAEAYIAQLDQAGAFKHKIATQVTPLAGFYAAEDYHQNYLERNPDNPYIIYNDLPKLERLKKQFPDLYKR